VLIAAEILFVLILVAVLVMLSKVDGFSLKNRFRRAKLERCWGGKERRQHPRFSQSLEVAYSVIKKACLKNCGGNTLDVSEGGLRLILEEKLSLGSILNLRISIPGLGQPAEAIGEVVWTEDAKNTEDPSGKRLFYSGVKFSFMKDPPGRQFVDYLRSLAPRQEGSEIP